MTRKKVVKYILRELYNLNKSIPLGEAYFRMNNGMSLRDFHQLLNEMGENGWLHIEEINKGPLPGELGLRYDRKEIRFTISIKGEEYYKKLNEPGIITWLKNNTSISISPTFSIIGIITILSAGALLMWPIIKWLVAFTFGINR